MNRNKALIAAALVFSLTLFFSNCDKKVGMREGTTPPPAASFCDTITYAKHIKPIIDANCATPGCHVQGGTGNGDLTTYSGVSAKVQSGSFKNRVFDSPSNPMPQSGMLPQNQLNIIKCWLDKGALND